MTTIANCTRLQDADLMRMRLEAAGIPCFMPQEAESACVGVLPLIIGYRLQVAEADVPRAVEILGEDPESAD